MTVNEAGKQWLASADWTVCNHKTATVFKTTDGYSVAFATGTNLEAFKKMDAEHIALLDKNGIGNMHLVDDDTYLGKYEVIWGGK